MTRKGYIIGDQQSIYYLTFTVVYRAEDYIYSSASNYAGLDQIIDVDCLFEVL